MVIISENSCLCSDPEPLPETKPESEPNPEPESESEPEHQPVTEIYKTLTA